MYYNSANFINKVFAFLHTHTSHFSLNKRVQKTTVSESSMGLNIMLINEIRSKWTELIGPAMKDIL